MNQPLARIIIITYVKRLATNTTVWPAPCTCLTVPPLRPRPAHAPALQVRPNLGLPQAAWSAIRFPGAVYAKVDASVLHTTAPSPLVSINVRQVDVVWRMYNVNHLKPALAFRPFVPPPFRKWRRGGKAGAAADEEEAVAAEEAVVVVSGPGAWVSSLSWEDVKGKLEDWAGHLAETHKIASQSLSEQLGALVSSQKKK